MTTAPRPKHTVPRKTRAMSAATSESFAAAVPAPAPQSLDSPGLYINRELSLIAFQRRVLEEAADSANPLIERVKFLSIVSSNMDEFFMVRVAGLWQQIESRNHEISKDGKGPSEVLEHIRQEVNELFESMYSLYRDHLLPGLAKHGIRILDLAELNPAQIAFLDDYFRRVVYPVLTPLAVDPGRPFPHISNLSLNIAAVVSNGDGIERFARVKVPDSLPQLIPVPSDPGEVTFVWLEQVIIANLSQLFPEMQILDAALFHVTRDAELAIQELETDDLLESIQEAVWRRRFRDVVRLQIDRGMAPRLLELLTTNLELGQEDIYRIDGPIDFSRLRAVLASIALTLKDKPFIPSFPAGFTYCGPRRDVCDDPQGDILLHHPFESFQPVVDFLRVAARDPDVLAIKMTLYRVGRNSPIVEALLDAIQNGKQVAAVGRVKGALR